MEGLLAAPQDDVGVFALELNLDVEALAFMWELPTELRAAIMANFDPTGTKDGNVLGRLQAYVRHMMRKNGFQPPEQLNSERQQAKDHHPAGMFGGRLQASAMVHPTQPAHGLGGMALPSPSMVQPLPGMALPVGGAAVPAGPAGEAVWRFVEQLGLGEAAAELIAGLPEDAQASVLRGFDPSGTKDGNVWGRLLGYVRSLWSRRLGLQEPASSYIRGLPEDVQVAVIAEFDGTGANVSARLMQYANFVATRAGTATRAPAGAAGAVGAALVQLRPAGAHTAAPRLHAQAAAQAAAPLLQEGATGEFAQALGLDAAAAAFLQALPEQLQAAVVTQFDPSGTKDGNIWGRLFAFARRLAAKHAGVGQAHVDHVRALPEEEQRQAILEWTCAAPARPTECPSGPGGPDGRAELRVFSQAWGLDGRAECFLQALPDAVREHVLAGFDGSGTKDGNVWGRLLGFARHTWARSLGLDQASVAFLKGLPEEAQMICLTDFDPSGTKDGNVAGRLQGFAKKALAQAGQLARAPGGDLGGPALQGGPCAPDARGAHGAQGLRAAQGVPAGPPLGADPLVLGFLERCGLDASATPYLESLPEDVLARVLSEFDPSGTKDGNVLGRLQGYVRLLTARRKRGEDDLGGPAKRPRALGV